MIFTNYLKFQKQLCEKLNNFKDIIQIDTKDIFNKEISLIEEYSKINSEKDTKINFKTSYNYFKKIEDGIILILNFLTDSLKNKKFIKFQQEPQNYYDLIIEGNSFFKPWKIITKGNYKELFSKKKPIVSIIGNFDKGKSFILSELSGINISSGFDKKTPWICGHSFNNTQENKFLNALFLDTAGFETPLNFSFNQVEKLLKFIDIFNFNIILFKIFN